MELFKPVILQDHGLMTLTLDLQGQILKKKITGIAGPIDMEWKLWWKFIPIRQSEANNFRAPETFCWFFFNFMFIAWDSRHEDLQLFLLSFKH